MSITHHHSELRRPSGLSAVANAVASFFGGIAHFFTSISRSIQASREFERLAMTSDEGLAAHGLTRDQAQKRIINSFL